MKRRLSIWLSFRRLIKKDSSLFIRF